MREASLWARDPVEGVGADPAVLAWAHFVGRGDEEALTPSTACLPGR